jgi:glucose/mannose-6-phosphate isomerase
MINEKYYNDIQSFHEQFTVGFGLAEGINPGSGFDKVIVCGMGGSSLMVELVNNFLADRGEKMRPVAAARGYRLPGYADKKCLIVLISHSGNTEETLSCLDEALQKGLRCVVFASGGKLAEAAKAKSLPMFVVPGGLQPRLSTGFMIAGFLKILFKAGMIKDYQNEFLTAASALVQLVDEDSAKALAGRLAELVPIIYSTDNASGIARISKIKFNENSKIQCFHNEFPELNHNEMVGWTKVLMKPYFLVLKSKFADARNLKRIMVFSELMKEKNLPVEVYEMKGENLLEEMLSTYMFIDFATYYLAEAYGIDPEPVKMVEDFKKRLG